MAKVNPYLTFNGNCEEAFQLYKSAFRKEFLYIGRYKDIPPSDRPNFQIEDDDKIMHVTLPIGGDTVLMGCDSPDASGFVMGNNICLSVATSSKEEADRLFDALSIGGQMKMAMNQTFWGAYFGVFIDRFGVNWTLSFDSNVSN